jgi:hypothetical protein
MPYQPEVIEAHRSTKCRINAADGERYVDGVIRWVIRAVSSYFASRTLHITSDQTLGGESQQHATIHFSCNAYISDHTEISSLLGAIVDV